MTKIRRLLLSCIMAILVITVVPEAANLLNTSTEVQAATVVGEPKLVSAKALGTTSVKFSWERVSGVSGYRIYRKTNGSNWRAVKTISDNRTSSYTDSRLKAGTHYTYTVRAYKKVNGRTLWGKYNTRGVYAVTGLEMPLLTVSYKTAARDVIDVSIGRYDGATSFIIYRKEKESDSWKKIGTTTKGSTRTVHYYDKNVNPEINYIYTVRGYCTHNGRNYYSTYRKDGRRCYEGSGFRYSEYNINKGSVVDVKQYEHDNRRIIWESANERIATIDSNGILRGVDFGKTEISATVDGKTYTSKVNVNRTIEVKKTDILCSKPTDINVYLCSEEDGHPTYRIEDSSIVNCKWGKPQYDRTEYGWCYYWTLTINPKRNGSTKIRLTNSINNEETVLNVTVTGMTSEKPRITASLFTNEIYTNVALLSVRNNGTLPLTLTGAVSLKTGSNLYHMVTYDGNIVFDTMIQPGQELDIGIVRADFQKFYITTSSICGFYFEYGDKDYIAVIDYYGNILSLTEGTSKSVESSLLSNGVEDKANSTILENYYSLKKGR